MRNPFSTHTSGARPPFHLLALTLHALLIVLAFLLAISIFVLEQSSVRLLRTNNNSDQVSLPLDPNETPVTVRLSIDRLPAQLTMGTTIAAFFLSVISAVTFSKLRSEVKITMTKGRQMVWMVTGGVAAIVNLLAVMACLGVAFAREKGSKSRFGPRNQVREGATVEATVETWLCKLYELNSQAGWAKHGCGAATAARWMLVPLGVCAFIIIILCAAQCWRVDKKEKDTVEKETRVVAIMFGAEPDDNV